MKGVAKVDAARNDVESTVKAAPAAGPEPARPAPPTGDSDLAVETARNLPLVVVERDGENGGAQPRRRLSGHALRFGALILIILVSIAIGGLVGLYRQPPGLQWAMRTLGLEPGAGTATPIAVPAERPATPGEPGQAVVAPGQNAQNTVVALGRLLPDGEVITLSPPSGVREARIAALKVEEGDRVEPEQILAILDNEPRLKAAVETARANVALREADLEKTRASIGASLAESRAALSRAEAAQRRTRQDFERTERLFKQGIAAQAVYDDKLAALEEAETTVAQRRATLSRYASAALDDQPDVIVARRNLAAARAELHRAETELEQAYVRAPFAGTVLELHARPGETPGNRGVLEFGDIDRMIARLEIYQSEIGRVSLGDPVTISAAALPGQLAGTVSKIGLQVKRQSVIGADPAANTDARIVEVTAALNAASSRIAARFTNLQVEARVETGSGR